jgi:hypothetical protein
VLTPKWRPDDAANGVAALAVSDLSAGPGPKFLVKSSPYPERLKLPLAP